MRKWKSGVLLKVAKEEERSFLLSSYFRGFMKCEDRNRIFLQLSAQYQNMSLPFDCIYSGRESRLTMLVLTQQTDGVCAVCQATGTPDCQRWHCCCTHQNRWKRKTAGKSCNFLYIYFESILIHSCALQQHIFIF